MKNINNSVIAYTWLVTNSLRPLKNLLSGKTMHTFNTNDKHDLKDHIFEWDVAFEEDKYGNDVPTQSCE